MIEASLCPIGGPFPSDPTLHSCQEHRFAVEHAAITGLEQIRGPSSLGDSAALFCRGEQVPLGTPSQTLRLIAASWKFRDQVVLLQLEYLKGDPCANRDPYVQYKKILVDTMQSFQPD